MHQGQMKMQNQPHLQPQTHQAISQDLPQKQYQREGRAPSQERIHSQKQVRGQMTPQQVKQLAARYQQRDGAPKEGVKS